MYTCLIQEPEVVRLINPEAAAKFSLLKKKSCLSISVRFATIKYISALTCRVWPFLCSSGTPSFGKRGPLDEVCCVLRYTFDWRLVFNLQARLGVDRQTLSGLHLVTICECGARRPHTMRHQHGNKETRGVCSRESKEFKHSSTSATGNLPKLWQSLEIWVHEGDNGDIRNKSHTFAPPENEILVSVMNAPLP